MTLPVLRFVKNKLIRWLCRTNKILFLIILLIYIRISCHRTLIIKRNSNVTIRYSDEKLEESLKEDKGTGCRMPHLDLFAKEVTQFDIIMPPVICTGQDWVKCYLHECRVVKKIKEIVKEIECEFRDIVYLSDADYILGAPQIVTADQTYILRASDHVKVSCKGKRIGRSWYSFLLSNGTTLVSVKWTGHAIGFRVGTNIPRAGGGPIDVLIFAFDSTSKNGFIRKMPKSYKYITEQLNATVLNGYNIVGDGTPAVLFPLLTGKTELELPDVRKTTNNTLDSFPFIFNKLKKLGYHTAYFEDSPNTGTFQYRYNGFKHQPADHYLRAFFLEDDKSRGQSAPISYCVGDTPRYQLMMNITEQFFKLPGSHFGLTFIADITHDNFNMISTADDATVRFFHALQNEGYLDNTLLFIIGDHGPRFSNVRDTMQGKLEGRLPFMAIRLPRALVEKRPEIVENLEKNVEALTTPHDIHTTILDALQMNEHMNPYKIKGADLKRGLSLFEPIPSSRSCSEAGVDAHWCACLTWRHVSHLKRQYKQAAEEFVQYINTLTDLIREQCEPRVLTSITWVMVQETNSKLMTSNGTSNIDGFLGSFNANTNKTKVNYQIKVTVGPGKAIYEATGTYLLAEDKFKFDLRSISRINSFYSESTCISEAHRHLNVFCYCNSYVKYIIDMIMKM